MRHRLQSCRQQFRFAYIHGLAALLLISIGQFVGATEWENVAAIRLVAGTGTRNLTSDRRADISDPSGSPLGTTEERTHRHASRSIDGGLELVDAELSQYGGPMAGVEIHFNDLHVTDDLDETTIGTSFADVLLGYAVRPVACMQLEILGFAGGGVSNIRVTNADAVSTTRGEASEYGMRLGMYAFPLKQLQLGIEVPYTIGKIATTYSYTDQGGNTVDVDQQFHARGWSVRVSIGLNL